MVACKAAILRFINQLLRMLNAHTDCKGLAHNTYALLRQHSVGITGTVTTGQNYCTSGDMLAICQHHALHRISLHKQILNMCFIANAAA